jgi:hypothetical protein
MVGWVMVLVVQSTTGWGLIDRGVGAGLAVSGRLLVEVGGWVVLLLVVVGVLWLLVVDVVVLQRALLLCVVVAADATGAVVVAEAGAVSGQKGGEGIC